MEHQVYEQLSFIKIPIDEFLAAFVRMKREEKLRKDMQAFLK